MPQHNGHIPHKSPSLIRNNITKKYLTIKRETNFFLIKNIYKRKLSREILSENV